MNGLTNFLDTLSTGAGRVIGALNPPQTTTVVQAPAPTTNGKAPLWMWLVGGAGLIGFVLVLVNFARKS